MTDKGSALEKICAEIRSSGVAPNAACGFWAQGEMEAGGETDALFDLASVTKSFFAVACARAQLREKIFRGVPLELMLAHRAGFPAHLPLFAPLVDGARVEVDAAIESAWASRSGAMPAPPLYSDVGYLLAGQEVASEGVDDFIRANVPVAEVGSARQWGDMTRAVPTERVAWRGGEIRGRVHDENAWAIGGDRSCGHAGLFGTIGAVLRFGAFVLEHLDELDWLHRPREGGSLRAGFDGKSPEGSSAGTMLGARSFGHLGFTGTSLWIDPDARIAVALLTNRVCPTRENVKIREARPRVHDALARLALAR